MKANRINLLSIKVQVVFCALLCLSIISCGEQEQVAKYQLQSIYANGSSIDPIPNGIQLDVFFTSMGEDLAYELVLNEKEGTFSTAGSYVIATDYINMPAAATERTTYNPSITGTFSRVGDNYFFDDAFLSYDFGTLDLTDPSGGVSTLVIQDDETLKQVQDFVVHFSDDGIVTCEITTIWRKI